MKIFLSSLENAFYKSNENAKKYRPVAEYILKHGIKFKWNLMSYYYIRKEERI